jgi:glutamine synthetase adenylyltransferase
MPGESAFLASAYHMYRRLELLIRIGLEERRYVLPRGEKLHRLARLYDGSSGPALHSRVGATMKRVREEFLEIAAFLGRVTPVEAGRGME